MIEPDVLEPWIAQAATLPLQARFDIVQCLSAMYLSRAGWLLVEPLTRDFGALPSERTRELSALKVAKLEAWESGTPAPTRAPIARLQEEDARRLGQALRQLGFPPARLAELEPGMLTYLDGDQIAAIAMQAVQKMLLDWRLLRRRDTDALVFLAAALPAPLPIDLGKLLGDDGVDELRPRESLAWVLARAGGPRVARQLGPALVETDGPRREWLLGWLRSIAAQVAQPAPPVVPSILDNRRHLVAFRTLGTMPDGARLHDVDPPAAPATVSKADARLHFVLEGAAVSGRTLLVGTRARLTFNHDAPPSNAVSIVESSHLEAAREANLDVLLLATATGRVRLVGPHFGIARFREGRLHAPLHFDLEAQGVGGAGEVHVDFLIRGESVYQSRIELRVATVSQGAAKSGRAGGPLASDLMDVTTRRAKPPRQQIVLSLGISGGQFRIALLDLRDGELEFSEDYEASRIDRVTIDAMIHNTTAALQGCYADERVWEGFSGGAQRAAHDGATAAALASATELIAFAGARLNADLRADRRIAEALEYIETNAQEGARISVSTDNIFLPWEILYPHPWPAHPTDEQRRARPLRPESFWGLRFAIETDKRGIGSLTRLARKHRSSPRKVSLNLNPDIRLAGASPADQPAAVNEAWAKALERERLLDGCQHDCQQMRRVLQDARTSATIVYLYCHGQPPNPALQRPERLELDANCALEPADLDIGIPYECAPIIFLNSCSGALSSPLVLSSFLKQFRQRGALGMIGTSYDVPIAFGAHFGREIVGACLNLQGSLAEAMRGLRRRHFQELGNPLPLFYTLQCYLEDPGSLAKAEP
jgi:hypothetical protein